VGAVDDGDKSDLVSTGDKQRHLLALMKTRLYFFRPAFFMFNYCHFIAPAVGEGRLSVAESI